jgi:hypothetical protein
MSRCRNRRCSQPEPAGWLSDKSNVIDGWLPSLTSPIFCVMRSSTITRLRRLTLFGAVLAPVFWVLKWVLQFFHILRDSPVPPRTLADRIFDVFVWDTIGAFLLAITLCSLILLYVIVCPPPRDIDQ